MRPNRSALLLAFGLVCAGSALAQPPLPTAVPTPPPVATPAPSPVATPTPPPTPDPAAQPPVTTPTPAPRSPQGSPTPRGRRGGKTPTAVSAPLTISGNQASLTLSAGGYSLDLTLQFEQVSNLSAPALGITAHVALPSELTGRLPAGVTPALPLVFAIEPPRGGGLDFDGIVLVNVHTHDLNYTGGSPLRLYSAPLGGAFVDITETTGTGSYRASGSKGGFSEFVIVADTRALDDAIAQKLDDLQGLLDHYSASIPDDAESALQGQLDDARDAWNARDYRTAAETMESFAATVEAHSGGSGIPDEWRSTRDLTNVAGYLRAAAGTLRYSLVLGE